MIEESKKTLATMQMHPETKKQMQDLLNHPDTHDLVNVSLLDWLIDWLIFIIISCSIELLIDSTIHPFIIWNE